MATICGLACEMPVSRSRQLCLSNKIFTYLAAGLPMVLSATPAQARLAQATGSGRSVVRAGRQRSARGNPPTVDRRSRRAIGLHARRPAFAADRRWHWEHPDDRGALLATVEAAVAVAS